MEKVLAVEINKWIAREIERFGGQAMNLNFHTTNVLYGERIRLAGKGGEPLDLGYVGRVTRVDHAVIDRVCRAGQVPVIPSMCLDDSGQKLNVNADTAATAVAQSLGAEKLVYLSDVNGVRREQSGSGIAHPFLDGHRGSTVDPGGDDRGRHDSQSGGVPGDARAGGAKDPHHRRSPAAFAVARSLHDPGSRYANRPGSNMTRRTVVMSTEKESPVGSLDSISSADTVALFKRYVIGNYRRYPVNLVRGEGCHVWDSEGERYLDFFPGWGCNLLGHCPPRVVAAVQDQVARLVHVPNTWHMDLQGRWAELLSQRSFGGQAFFCNSGTEANEAAIKLARLHTPPEKYKIITFEGGFHGRTLGATAATAQPKYHEGLGPLMAGFTYTPFDDLQAVADRIDEETCAIMVEPVQGEGGVRIPRVEFLQGLRRLADDHAAAVDLR